MSQSGRVLLRLLNNVSILNDYNILPRRDHLSDLANGQGSGRNLIRPLGLLIYVAILRYQVLSWPPQPQPHKPQAPRRHYGTALSVKTSAHAICSPRVYKTQSPGITRCCSNTLDSIYNDIMSDLWPQGDVTICLLSWMSNVA